METIGRAYIREEQDHLKASLATAGAVKIQDANNPYDALRVQLAPTNAEMLTPTSPGYGESIKRWSDTSEKKAAAVIRPTSADEVSVIVKFSAAQKIPFVVCGGGHSTSSASASEGGIVIDLCKMRNVSVEPAAMTVAAEGGCTWEDVDAAAAQHGLATVGGTVNHTGVGGLTLGGGYGWLTPRHGLAIDNLLSATMVLADGRIVTASEHSHPDLFWAIRGAGASFGVVTEFLFRAHPQPNPVYAGLLIFPPSALPDIVEFANAFHAKTDGDQGMVIALSSPPPTNAAVVICALFYNGPASAGKAFFAPLLELEALGNHIDPAMPWPLVNTMINAVSTYGGRKIFGGSSFRMPLTLDFMQALLKKLTGFCDSHEGVGESVVALEILSYDKVRAVSNEAMAFCNRGDYYQVGTVFKWHDPALDEEVRVFNREFNRWVREAGGLGNDKEGVGVYANYIMHGASPEEVFGRNAARLQELKCVYDPDNLFNKWHNLKRSR
ncbi:hypothetical protein W97_07800 [Coniosporium apollinis CBS 100218]|uniref:FAD-binding PCMH-type domain-containing protein n=1 Tax=Coniosporium apollinis (strain CBS 100218) TaxID=1168221 RepID=R7Z312_CONA1|nr:uncharacterized protein W97_07800 [Coniosporium apollinis CBS 100218]EON68542.1 hypothetical protein W97_07800 [Coniosporium apollinis CBS 100218]